MRKPHDHRFKGRLPRLNWVLSGLFLLYEQKLEHKQQLTSQESVEVIDAEIATMERFILSIKQYIAKLGG